MCINVTCSADIAVTKPLLNFLQAHAIGIKQAGAGRGNGYASSGVLPENLGNAGSGNRAESAFPQGLHSLVAFSELLRHYGVDVSDKGISKWEKGVSHS